MSVDSEQQPDTTEHALVVVQDDEALHVLWRHDDGGPYGPRGVIATARRAVREPFRADLIAAELVHVWRESGSEVRLSEAAIESHDPRWYYELEYVRGRVRLTIHDLRHRVDAHVLSL